MRVLILFLFLTVPVGHCFAQERFKITMVPYQLDGGHNAESLVKKLTSLVDLAAKEGPDLIAFPELISLDFIPNDHEGSVDSFLVKGALTFGRMEQLAREKAVEHKVAIMLGSFHRKVEGSYLNTTVLALRDGRVILQDKMYITPWEAQRNFKNGEKLQVFEIDGVRTVILNCHDIEFPDLSNALIDIAPELILVPSMTDDRYGYERVARTSMARAVEHMSYVIQVGTVGTEKADWHTYYGGAGVHTPQNKTLAPFEDHSRPNVNDIFSVQLNFDLLRKERAKPSSIYPARDLKARAKSFEIVQ